MWRLLLATAMLLPSAVPVSAQACLADAGQVVDSVYRQLLEREPDPAGRAFAQELAAGRANVRQVVAAVAKSPEYRARLWEPVVEGMFRQIRNAAPEREFVQTVARSVAERRQTLDDVAVAFAVEETQSQPPDTAVIAMYRRLLGRDPSAAEVAGQREVVERQGPQALARAIVASPEYGQRVGRSSIPAPGASPYEGAVRALYRRLLGREPDADGLANFTRMVAEAGFDPVIDRILASPEYRETYGDQGVPGGTARYCGAPVGTTGR